MGFRQCQQIEMNPLQEPTQVVPVRVLLRAQVVTGLVPLRAQVVLVLEFLPTHLLVEVPVLLRLH